MTFKIKYFFIIITTLTLKSCGDSSRDSKLFKDSRQVDKNCSLLGEQVYSLTSEKKENFFHLNIFSKSYPIIKENIHPNIGVLTSAKKYEKSHLSEKHLDFSFFWENIPFCLDEMSAHIVRDELILIGSYPQVKNFDHSVLKEIKETNWITKNKIKNLISSQKDVHSISTSPCWHSKNNKIEPAWNVNFLLDKSPYEALILKDKALDLNPLFIPLDSHHQQHGRNAKNIAFKLSESLPTRDVVVKAYVKSDGKNVNVENIDLKAISTGGGLCSERFSNTPAGNLRKAFSLKGDFNYSVDNHQFAQVSVFANLQIHADWITSLLPKQKWYGPQIDIVLFSKKEDDPNKIIPEYVRSRNMSSNKTSAAIRIGKGDGVHLKNLWFDPEVAQHELGHHVFFRKMTKLSNSQTFVLHEGLSDYLVMAKTQNSCIGEWICVKDGTICHSESCLRTADNNFKITSSDLPIAEHARSQLISGLLWSIGEKITHKKTATILYKAIDYMTSNAGYENLLASLLFAEKELYNETHKCVILKEFKNRDFVDILKNISHSCSL